MRIEERESSCASQMNEALTFTGTEVGYYFICKKKLWWFSHGVGMEHSSDRVKLGKLVHQESYQRRKKELNIDDRIVIDWREGGVIHEVKLTDKMEAAHEMQLTYYLYYLKHAKGVDNLRGQIDYPRLRETKTVELTEEREREIERALGEMREIVKSGRAPTVEWMRVCRECAYAELCWG